MVATVPTMTICGAKQLLVALKTATKNFSLRIVAIIKLALARRMINHSEIALSSTHRALII